MKGLLIASLLLLPSQSVGQGLDIGGIELKLGQSQESALAALSAVYDVNRLETRSGTLWVVSRKGRQGDLGTFQLANQKVVEITKEFPFTDGGRDLRGDYEVATQELRKRAGKKCSVEKPSYVAGFFSTECAHYVLTFMLPAYFAGDDGKQQRVSGRIGLTVN